MLNVLRECAFDSDAHAPGRSGDQFHCRLQRESVEVRHLAFSNRLYLIPGNGRNLVPVGLSRTFLDLCGLEEGNRHGGLLDLEAAKVQKGSGAGPTGGAGLAAPALIWSLMNPVTSFAIFVIL